MKFRTVFPFLSITLLLPFLCDAQQWEPPIPPNDREAYEKQDDPYLPNAYNNKNLSPAYRYDGRSHSRNSNTEIFTRQVNVSPNQKNILGDAANEPSIAVNPLNENEIVIGWRQFDNVNSNFRQAGYGYSSDGGQAWTFPGAIDPGVFHSDPVLDYDNAGNFYYNSLASQPTDEYPCYVYKSGDAGVSWNTGVYMGGGDKQWMTIDRSGGMGEGNIYSSWTSYYSHCPPGFFTRSTDGGSSFDTCSILPEDLYWGTQAVGINGELYVSGKSIVPGRILVAKSVDAQNPARSTTWTSVSTVELGGYIVYRPNINPKGIAGQISIDVDRSNGPGQHNVYVLASIEPFMSSDQADVMFNKSSDGGMHWNTTPTKVNDDASSTNTQWFGTMSVAPNGRIDVIWLDTRDHPGSDSSALYYSYSIDEGTTWSPNEKLSDSFDPHRGYPRQNKMGDYFDMISSNTGAHLAWANTLNGEQDVYYSFITPPIMTGMEDVSENAIISVYPNPTSGLLEIDAADKRIRIEIFATDGKKILSTSVFDTRHVIDISSQPAGIYFLKAIGEDRLVTVTKIIKM
ncbi:MAG: T9SS type A sorting domain-containing protein [Saprospiraceae bacterium]|nr:T9SS type A sorting domain-containing protein [Candidatus Opimibacter skivensis]